MTTETDQETRLVSGLVTGIPFNATVVSIIIRDFVHLTERLSPENLLELMTSYHERIGLQVSQQLGEITSISNHSMVVIFSEVEGTEHHARRAMRFALAIAIIARQTYFWIRQTFPELGFDKFGVGIGIHTGELIVAEFGIAPHMQRVASGHAVTIASLLSIKSKGMGWNIVCSEQAFNASGKGVTISQRGTVGAVWLNHPIDVVEIAVVRNHRAKPVEDMTMPPLAEEVGIDRTFPLLKSVRPSVANPLGHPFIPGYQLLHPIGKGGMSSVFLVKRLRDNESFALKFFNGSVSEDSEFLCRFVDEYGLLEQITHNNVIRIYDQGVTDDALFIVLEYMAGGSLRQRIDAQTVDLDLSWRVLCDMTQALMEIHSHGIIHRDVKPENIMFRTDGEAVLGDFSVAKQMHDQRGFQDPRMVGTPYFISPEQASGGDVNEQSDIYSLGAVFYNMLTGTKPYSADSLEAIIDQHLNAPVPVLPECYRHFQPLLNGMMAKNPADRYVAKTLWKEISVLENQYEPPPDRRISLQETSAESEQSV
jgi:serine/threonine-protein kinase PpkA